MNQHSLNLFLVDARRDQNVSHEQVLRQRVSIAAHDVNDHKAPVLAERVRGVASGTKDVVNETFIVRGAQFRHDCSEVFDAFGAVQIV